MKEVLMLYGTENLTNVPRSIWTIRGSIVNIITEMIKHDTSKFNTEALRGLINNKEHSINLVTELYFSIFYIFHIDSTLSLNKEYLMGYTRQKSPLAYSIDLIRLQEFLLIRYKDSFDEIMNKNPTYIIYWKELDSNKLEIDINVQKYLEESDSNFLNFFNKFRKEMNVQYSSQRIEKNLYFDITSILKIVDNKYLEAKINTLIKSYDTAVSPELYASFQETYELYKISKSELERRS